MVQTLWIDSIQLLCKCQESSIGIKIDHQSELDFVTHLFRVVTTPESTSETFGTLYSSNQYPFVESSGSSGDQYFWAKSCSTETETCKKNFFSSYNLL